MQFEDRKLSETVGNCRRLSVRVRKLSETVGTEEINTKRQEKELLFIFKFIVTILNNGQFASKINKQFAFASAQKWQQFAYVIRNLQTLQGLCFPHFYATFCEQTL